MTIQTVITATGSGTWVPPPDCPPGTAILIEGWGAGSGAGGTTTNGSGGGAGCYASTTYTLTSADSAGIAYSVGTGSSGTGAANPSAGGNTTVATQPKNLIPNTTFVGATVGGAFPPGWVTVGTGITFAVAALGTDATTGLAYMDVSISGTLTGTSCRIYFSINSPTGCSGGVSPSVSYTGSGYLMLVSGALTNITTVQMQTDFYQVNGSTYINTLNSFTISGTPPSLGGSLARHSGTITSLALSAMQQSYLTFAAPTSSVIGPFTVRIAGFQFEQAASVTAYQVTPTAYVLANGGGAPVTTTGGATADAGNCFGITVFKGGNGAAFNANGSGGGGSAGSAGAGAVGTTAGVGGTADNGSGGTGGARKTSSPGNAGTGNVEGGGGGGAVITATSATGGAGGAPGGGAGAAETTSSTGGTGARGQVRFGYIPFNYLTLTQIAPILAQ